MSFWCRKLRSSALSPAPHGSMVDLHHDQRAELPAPGFHSMCTGLRCLVTLPVELQASSYLFIVRGTAATKVSRGYTEISLVEGAGAREVSALKASEDAILEFATRPRILGPILHAMPKPNGRPE